MEKTETIDLKDLDKQMYDMKNDELHDFFLLIHEVHNRIVDEMKKRMMI